MIPLFLLTLGIAPEPEIVVTAALVPVTQADAPASVTVVDAARIEALGEPLITELLRLTPGVSVSASGPPGSQAQVRIRGAEANHSLLLIDGIRFNDPASGNEARFELLSSEGVQRIELVRGPQSALYGAEAIGGVIALSTLRRSGPGASALAEAGGKGFLRGSAAGAVADESRALALYGGYHQADGIDSFDNSGERDGYDNLTIGGAARLQASAGLAFTAAGRFIEADSEFDGFDPATFQRADTEDATHNRIGAGRIAAQFGDADTSDVHGAIGATLLQSSNRNRLDDAPLNRTEGRRWTADGLASKRFAIGGSGHRLIIAGDYEKERFTARDQIFFGATDQRRTRNRAAVVGEWRAAFGKRLNLDFALRHDSFEGFADATTVRASALARVAGPLSALLSYGEGIARPTFFDLFGFFPGSFAGNSGLAPERSRGWEAGLRYDRGPIGLAVTGYQQRLRSEIVDVFDPVTFISSTANASGTSRRRGLELEGEWRPSPALRVFASYAYLDAGERQIAGTSLLKEVRRPRHSASLAGDGRWGALSAGISLAYVGTRIDTDFDSFPAARVRLDDYVLGGARIAYRIAPAVELFARVSNLFDADYQDVVGYRTQGRTLYGGIRLRYGD